MLPFLLGHYGSSSVEAAAKPHDYSVLLYTVLPATMFTKGAVLLYAGGYDRCGFMTQTSRMNG